MTAIVEEGPEAGKVPRDVLHQMGTLGMFGLRVPEEHGGLGLGMLAAAGVLAICAVLVGTLYPRTSHPTNEQLPEGADS